MEREEEFKKK